MVVFNKESFTIEVHVGSDPIEEWLRTHDDLIDLLQSANPDMTTGKTYYHLLELLRQMMHDRETAKKMTIPPSAPPKERK